MALKIAIASHIVFDSIQNEEGRLVQSLGGSACYCGLMAKKLQFDVIVATKVGRDFTTEIKKELELKGITINENMCLNRFNTTRFYIRHERGARQLYLHDKCAPLIKEDIQDIQTDCWMVSPVIDEVPTDVLELIVKKRGAKNFVMLDPQGYTRIINIGGQISMVRNLSIDLSGINAIKVDPDEMAALTGGLDGLEGMKFLHYRNSIPFVICTGPLVIHLIYNDSHYWLRLPEFKKADSTGLGDILGTAFCCICVKENDPLWAICFGAGAVQAALETRKTGLDKIPSESEIEENASYYYNSMEYQKI